MRLDILEIQILPAEKYGFSVCNNILQEPPTRVGGFNLEKVRGIPEPPNPAGTTDPHLASVVLKHFMQ